MFLDIRPVRNENYDCFQGIVASVATHFKCNYLLLFAGVWGFSFEPLKMGKGYINFGERLIPEFNTVMFDLLERFHGCKITIYDTDTINEIKAVILNELSKGLPVGIYLDSYWCPWNIAYKKYHITHYCLVIGFDDDKESFMFIDPYCSDNIEKLSIVELEKGYGNYFTFKFTESKEQNIENELNYIIKLCLVTLKLDNEQLNSFKMMRSFADEFEQYMDLDKEISGYEDTYAVPFFRQMKAIESCRKNFSLTLNYIAETCNDKNILQLSSNMLQASNIWSKIRLMIIRMSMTSSQSGQIKKIVDKIREVTDYEESIACKLNDIILS